MHVASFNYSDLPPSYFHKEDYLVEVLTKSAPKLGLSSKVWARMLANGEVALLLDGFDELTGQVNQEKFIQAIRATTAVWPTCPVIATSRPINTNQLTDIGFIRATIADFTTSEIAEFVGQWVTALFKSGSQTVTSSAYKQSLLNTLAQRPEVRRLARNPALLTSLCVVHHYKGGLPDGR